MTLKDWYLNESDKACNKAAKLYKKNYIGFKILDAITGDNITEEISLSDWSIANVDAVEMTRDCLNVYIAI